MGGPPLRRLLTFARDLQGAATYEALLEVTRAELAASLGYRHAWFYVAETEAAEELRLIDIAGVKSGAIREEYPLLTVRGDVMLEEILRGDAPVIVEDARTDPRTDKEIVARLGNRTIVNVPLRLLDRPLGALGTGTFGDEGCRPPSTAEVDYLIGMASQLSVAAARIRYLEQREESERERLELERRIQRIQKLESLGTLAGGIAHDFNNLLTVVLAHASLLQQSADEDVRSGAEAIVASAERAGELTRQLLAMGRRQELEAAPLDLNERIEELASMLGRVFPETIAIDLVLGERLPLVSGDASQLDQVLLNLCVNARDAMPDGGRLTVATEEVLVDGSFVETHAWAKPGRYLLIAVTDTGSGMPRETVERVFEPFFTTKTDLERPGTGLGLAVAYGIVRQHDGMMHCYSEVGLGTTFKVFLPVLLRAAVDVGTEVETTARGGTERILVAEDDPALRLAVGRILEKAGYTVVTVEDGRAACEAAEHEPFDLVVLDVVMPRMGGPEAVRRIRDDLPSARFILSTGYGARVDASDLIESGVAHRLLAKPYAADGLLRAIRELLD